MSKSRHASYPEAFRARRVERVRARRTPSELAGEFERPSESIRQGARQADLDEGIAAAPRKLRLIHGKDRKRDRADVEYLGEVDDCVDRALEAR
jgi:transposase-like protein